MVGNVWELKQLLMKEFHASFQGGHSCVEAITKRISNYFYWKGLKKDIKVLVGECEICQRNKFENGPPTGLLQPLLLPTGFWEEISMDLIDGLPNSHGKSTILVVVDRMSKYAHFLVLSHLYFTVDVAKLFLDQIYRLHGLLKSIVSYIDLVFVSKFWTELFRLQGVQILHSTTYHPQTDRQTEVVNRCFEQYLRCMTSERP